MKLIEFLKKEGLTKLSEKFNITVKPSVVNPELVCLTYSQLNTPKNEITNECRGIVLNKDTFEIVCYPFTRFNDYNPKVDIGFDKSNFKIFEKVDGSLMSVYFYKNEWRVSTKSTCDGNGMVLAQNCTYSEYFWKVWNKLGYDLPTDTKCTYIFEFKFPSETQFITKSTDETITLIGCRDIITYKEYHSPYYQQLEQARSEMIDLRALKAEFIKQHKSEKPQVDFDLLKHTIMLMSTDYLEDIETNMELRYYENLVLFFKNMKNPRFATKASHLLK